MTWFDLLVIVVLVLSIGFAAIRGAIREIATLAALGGGAFIAYLLFKPLLGAFGLEGSVFGMAGLAAVLLGLFFILLYVAAHFGLKRVSLSQSMAHADRIGGGVFGLFRGLALIGLGFLGYAYYADEQHRPEAVNDAMLLPLAQGTANFFESLAPKHDSQDIITPDKINDKVNAANDGYARGDRAALNEIVTTTTTSDQTQTSSAVQQENQKDPIADILSVDDDSGQ